jgi:hypothetical protein
LEYGDKPTHFVRGHLDELGKADLTIDMPGRACQDFLAATQEGSEIRIDWWSNGPGARQVTLSVEGSPNVKKGTICTADSPSKNAQVGLQLKMLRGSSEYALETYFASQIEFGVRAHH